MQSATPASRSAVLPTWSDGGDGEPVWFLGTLAIIRVPGEATDDRFSLTEFLFRRDTSPALHTHPQDESYLVLDGRITVQAGAERFELGPGGATVLPAGVPHTFRADSETARVLVLSTPAGIEQLVRDASVPAPSPVLPPEDAPRPTPARVEQIYRQHACIEVGPRLSPDD
jgi:quercetin dioxygenase-like cupin family protein